MNVPGCFMCGAPTWIFSDVGLCYVCAGLHPAVKVVDVSPLTGPLGPPPFEADRPTREQWEARVRFLTMGDCRVVPAGGGR